MAKRSAAVLVVASALLAGAGAVTLTEDNFDKATLGKTFFLKFFAPWCGHCKSMAADWNRLAADFERHPVALIGEVDCTGDAANLCERFDVEGFPTLLWGNGDSTEAYEGGRDYASMKEFADEFVTKPVCSVLQLEACSETERAALAAVETQTDQQLLDVVQHVYRLERVEEDQLHAVLEKLDEVEDRMIAAHKSRIDEGEEDELEEELEAELEAELERMDEKVEKTIALYDDRIAAMKSEHNMKFVAQVLRKRGIEIPEDEEDDDDNEDDDDGDDDDDDSNMSEGEL